MIALGVQLDLMEFIENKILPRYNEFDKAHQLPHVINVIKRSLSLATQVGADINMVYTIAAYHDLGLEGPRAIHHLTGGKILMADARLKKWFTNDQIVVMKEAVEDHRASSSHSPRSIYGKIVAEADRELKPQIVFTRTILFGLSHYPQMDKEQQWKRFVEHLENKYSIHGYIKLWISGSENEKNLNAIRTMLTDKERLRNTFEGIYAKEIVAMNK